jgi:mono/diheme cytochrome c family protein
MFSTGIALGALSTLLLVTSAACQPARQQNPVPASVSGLDGPARNGARIHFTGVSERGTAVTSTGATKVGGGMMGGYGQWLTCASCHGPEGRGGTHVMLMWTMTAPDIRYAALRNMSELKGRQRPYDIDDFLQQVESGRHPDGTEVKADMPRWQMSGPDLADLFTFLKAVPE